MKAACTNVCSVHVWSTCCVQMYSTHVFCARFVYMFCIHAFLWTSRTRMQDAAVDKHAKLVLYTPSSHVSNATQPPLSKRLDLDQIEITQKIDVSTSCFPTVQICIDRRPHVGSQTESNANVVFSYTGKSHVVVAQVAIQSCVSCLPGNQHFHNS